MSDSAIITMVVGTEYEARWQMFCRSPLERYARKHGLDLVVLDRPIDDGPLRCVRSLAWQKLLIGTVDSLKGYDNLIWVDADIVVNDGEAPNILTGLPAGKVGAVRYQPLLSYPLFAAAHRKMCDDRSPMEYNNSLVTARRIAGLAPATGDSPPLTPLN